MDNENIQDVNNTDEIRDRKEKYLDLIEELEEENKLGTTTSMNPDQQLDNDDILRQR